MGTFESFKRQAVTLERQLEDKVAKYQQVSRSALLWNCEYFCGMAS